MREGPERISAHAPGRVELLGNHTDYNEGVVLGAAIDRGITVTGQRRGDELMRIRATGFGEVEVSKLQPLDQNRWANYVLGVACELVRLQVPVSGFELDIKGDLPAGAGLSSSAAIELATALLLLKLFPGNEIPRLEIAKACQRAEHRFVGVQSGLLDQVVSLFGRADHAVFFDVRSEEIRTVPFPPGLALIVAESGKMRQLISGEYNLRREQTRAAARVLGVRALRDVNSTILAARPDLPGLLRRRATHVVQENERVFRAVEFLERGDGDGFGQLMNASHESSRWNFENSTPQLDALVSIAQQLEGVLGARLTGAGFGGAAVILCQRDRAEITVADLSRQYSAQAEAKPQTFICRIAPGAA